MPSSKTHWKNIHEKRRTGSVLGSLKCNDSQSKRLLSQFQVKWKYSLSADALTSISHDKMLLLLKKKKEKGGSAFLPV